MATIDDILATIELRERVRALEAERGREPSIIEDQRMAAARKTINRVCAALGWKEGFQSRSGEGSFALRRRFCESVKHHHPVVALRASTPLDWKTDPRTFDDLERHLLEPIVERGLDPTYRGDAPAGALRQYKDPKYPGWDCFAGDPFDCWRPFMQTGTAVTEIWTGGPEGQKFDPARPFQQPETRVKRWAGLVKGLLWPRAA